MTRHTSKIHVYLSTACFHGQHDECRQACKFCESWCRCDCHEWPDEVEQVLRPADGLQL